MNGREIKILTLAGGSEPTHRCVEEGLSAFMFRKGDERRLWLQSTRIDSRHLASTVQLSMSYESR